ncbi:MAG: hypothetical protein AAGH15_23400 [Myxococcota bacterium]
MPSAASTDAAAREVPPGDLGPDPLLDAACRRYGICGDDRFLVLSLVERSEATWPGCCGAGCEPCMEDVADAARALRRARAEA